MPNEWSVLDRVKEPPLEVNFFSLLGAPEKFDGKVVAVAGVLDTTGDDTIGDEGIYLFFSVEAYVHSRYDQAILLLLDSKEKIEATHQFDRRWVRVEGVFVKPGPWGGGLGTALGAAAIGQITRIIDWGFGVRQLEPSPPETDRR